MKPKKELDKLHHLTPLERYLVYIRIAHRYLRYKYPWIHLIPKTALTLVISTLLLTLLPTHPIRIPTAIGLTAVLNIYVNI